MEEVSAGLRSGRAPSYLLGCRVILFASCSLILMQSQGLRRGVIFSVSNPRFYNGCRHVCVPFCHGSRSQSLVSITKDVAVATKCVAKHFICWRFAFWLSTRVPPFCSLSSRMEHETEKYSVLKICEWKLSARRYVELIYICRAGMKMSNPFVASCDWLCIVQYLHILNTV